MIPFHFDNIMQTTMGRALTNEADVRLFYELGVILACRPIALSMVSELRSYDLLLCSEKTLSRGTRPNISIHMVHQLTAGLNWLLTHP
jgi:hypothetical protein